MCDQFLRLSRKVISIAYHPLIIDKYYLFNTIDDPIQIKKI